ncbi:group II intron reverse transcriptase/maturase [Novosphingobium sp. G106]|uniref:group II intron reverse transcriptase/maturase n=1 Tax=Novosphingobium sp. G106 TaxID=2849500 RepID=UPI001C2D9E85|nr:group II intron reverse transcriptase/maturase [Novosphingobium sp. G106]MBV1688991.1 group II intron reverse transcriptase/maturase [Novosphingobium sp. G106]
MAKGGSGYSEPAGGGRQPGPVNTEFILDMQCKLYRWSQAAPDKTFGDLFNLVSDRRTLGYAWRKMARNRGSRTPGTDGMGRIQVEQRTGGVERFLDEIEAELRAGTYRPQPVRQRLIPKAGKPGQVRPLGIPTLKDRLVQMALKLVLEPIFEADFYPTSFGFRRRRSTHDAIAMIQRQVNPNRWCNSRITYVIEGDIKGCFDNIDHHRLMERVRRRIRDRKILRLVLAFLRAGIMVETTVRHPVAGTPQGGIISPLLSNIVLTAIDERYRRWTPGPYETVTSATQRRGRDYNSGKATFYIVRYADDFVVLVSGPRAAAEAEKEALARFLREELRLELSPEKTLITDIRKGFDFLGYRIVKKRSPRSGRFVCKLLIPLSRLQRLRDTIKARTKRPSLLLALSAIIDNLNPLILGWRTYYRHAMRACREFSKLDHWLWERIYRWLRKKHPKTRRTIFRRFYRRAPGGPLRWTEGTARLRRFSEGGHLPLPVPGHQDHQRLGHHRRGMDGRPP